MRGLSAADTVTQPTYSELVAPLGRQKGEEKLQQKSARRKNKNKFRDHNKKNT
jgi:hypothetical protein